MNYKKLIITTTSDVVCHEPVSFETNITSIEQNLIGKDTRGQMGEKKGWRGRRRRRRKLNKRIKYKLYTK